MTISSIYLVSSATLRGFRDICVRNLTVHYIISSPCSMQKHTYCRESADLYISAIKSSQPCCKYFMSVGELGRKRKTQKKQKESSTFNSTEITSDSQSLTDTHTPTNTSHEPWVLWDSIHTCLFFLLWAALGSGGFWNGDSARWT